MDFYYQSTEQEKIPLECITKSEYNKLIDSSLDVAANWLLASNRSVSIGSHHLIPDEQGKLAKVIAIIPEELSTWSIASLPFKLPVGDYYLSNVSSAEDKQKLSLGWGLGAYQYTKFQDKKDCARLQLTSDIEIEKLKSIVSSTHLVRDLVNTPANEMLPSELSEATKSLADSFGADFIEIKGDDLLKQNYPLIYTVGKASVDAPRLLKISWGDESNPLLGLVGKGVCFDSGGLDLKSAAGMRWMKKDMGGAAHVLGVASFIMANKLPVRLEVLIPAVENAVSGNAFRPGDVIVARNGKSVEIDNTDAEGRLVMADALAELSEKKPDLLIDFATLTGAARVAVGTEVAAFFSNNDTTSHDLYKAAKRVEDDIWRLPIHHAYFDHIKSTIADVVNCSSGGYGGAITAALFLNEFVEKKCDWLHFDMMAYNMRSRPGRPKGGEAMGLRGVCEFLTARYSN